MIPDIYYYALLFRCQCDWLQAGIIIMKLIKEHEVGSYNFLAVYK